MYIKFFINFLLSFLLFINASATNLEIDIKYKVNDEIITNLDIIEEKNYLIFLRPKLNSLSEDELIEISKNSLIKEIIKKKEIRKIFKDIKNEKMINDIKKKLFNFKNVKNEEEFVILAKRNNINHEKIFEKIKFEGLWNDLIYRKFNSLVKIDNNILKEELLKKASNKKKYEYKLSEILFDIEKDESYEKKYRLILNDIKKNGFKSAALKFSISNSFNTGGEIGWIKETLLSKKIINELKNLKNNEITVPMKYPNGYLILKVNEKKEIKEKINIEKELQDKIRFETNRQLNQFSLLYYKKLKQNSKINEY